MLLEYSVSLILSALIKMGTAQMGEPRPAKEIHYMEVPR